MAIHQTDSRQLLEQLSALPAGKKRGKLRIYLGYAAGVGKTYAMLSDAQEAKGDGVDVVAGYIEPHERPETLDLVEGLEVLPPLLLDYKGVQLREFDLDAALLRRPALVLVDELAHTNAAGCRHKKRYQDVEELLRAGIDVFTTINVQHIESLNDIVGSISGVQVSERIPDSVFDDADQIEIVDIEPEDLIERLNKGKIYRETQAKRALENFFTREKLIALREIALRCAADQVNRKAVQNEVPNSGTPHTNEHILVCLSSSPANAKVIRSAARMADAFHSTFTVLFVETPGTHELEDKKLGMLRDNLRLAEQLGAQISTVFGEDVPGQVAEFARTSHVSKIVIGRSARHKNWLKPSYVDRLIELVPNIDLYIVPDTEPAFSSTFLKFEKHSGLSLADFAKSFALLAACTLIGFAFSYLHFSVANIITVFILGVLVNAVVTKSRVYSLFSSVLSVLVFNFFFTEPLYSLKASDPGYPVTFVVMLLAALITGTLAKQIKEQARSSAQKAYRTEVLLETSRILLQARDKEDILKETGYQLIKLLERTVVLYPSQGVGLAQPLVFIPAEGPQDGAEYTSTEERAVAEWVFRNNKRAGATTNTLSAVKCLYLVVRGRGTALAVVGIPIHSQAPLEAFEKNILLAILGECGLALEKEEMNETQREISTEMQKEKLRSNLLRAISHDLRTPLTSISGNAGILMNNSGLLEEGQKQELYTGIYDDSLWLIDLVENLLSITRLENGTLALDMQPELLDEIVAEALRHIDRHENEHRIETQMGEDLLLAKMDHRLITQVIINIMDNAIKYTPVGSRIKVAARRDGKLVRVEVADDGPGLADAAKSKLFDMFYTDDNMSKDGRRGLGLGLFLCKSIIQAHGGSIYVVDNLPKGTIVGFTLPALEVDIHE